MKLPHDYFEENLAQLKKYHPQAWQTVMAYTGKPLGVLCLAADGTPNLLGRTDSGEEIFFHYPAATAGELADYYALVPEDATGVTAFIGMGLGYTPPAMLKSRRHLRHLAVFEPETGIFIQALHALDLTPFLADRRLSLAIGPNINVAAVLAPMSHALQLENLNILRHLPCFRLCAESYQATYDQVFKHGNAYNIGGNTTTMFGGKFIENRLRHMSTVHHQQLLEHLKDIFTGVPAFIVAAGPSLDKNVRLLQHAKGRSVIIAADTALPALLANGVTPDFTSCIDMEDIILEKIVNVSAAATETSLICSSWVTSLIPKTFPARQVFWTFTAQNMERWLSSMLGGTMLTSGASTVAQLNFIAATVLGCSPIVFVGQDLAYSELSGHAQHTSLTSKELIEKFFEREEILWVDGYGGTKVPTDRSYLSFKYHFEECMATFADREFVNATEGGVRLEGAREMPLREVLDRYCGAQVDVPAMIKMAESQAQMPGRQRMIDGLARTLKDIDGIKKEMTSLERLSERLSKEITGLREQGMSCLKFDMLPPSLRGKLLELDALNSTLDKAKVWPLLDEATMEGLRQCNRLNHELQQLADHPENYLEWLDKSIKRFTVINQFRRQVLSPFTQQLLRLRNHLQREHFLRLKLTKRKGGTGETKLELLRLYFGSGDLVLLEKMIKAHAPAPSDSAEITFYLGAIAASRCQFDEMELNFTKSMEVDPSWSDRIDEYRKLLAERFLGFAWRYYDVDQRVVNRMLFKAIRYTTEHPEVRQMLATESARLLAKSDTLADQKILANKAALLSPWCHELSINPNLLAVLGPGVAAALYKDYGKALATETENNSAAVQAFAAAIALSPEDAELYLLHATAAFALNDFDSGVLSLNRAVSLDRRHAGYWEQLGDELLAKNLPADAAAAYEKCFLALPKEIGLLKKIGACYLAMGQNEAALEAYRIYQEKASRKD
jgi:hypothetical protein